MNDGRHHATDEGAREKSRPVGNGDAATSGRRIRYRPDVRPVAGSARWNRSEAWNVPDGGPDDPGDQGRPLGVLVSFHYLRAAVRRRWRMCAVFALFGLLLAAGFLMHDPAPRTATTTLMLIPQDPGDTSAINTDLSLLKTRTVAERTIEALAPLKMRPDDMMNSVIAVSPDSSELLQLTMSAPTDADAVRRLDVFSREYLKFRAAQISKQSHVLINGYENEIDSLQSQAQTLRKQVEHFSNGRDAGDQLTEAVTKLSQINDQISTIQGTVDDQTLQLKATLSASRVIDPAAPTSPGHLRRIVLDLASGLIGGLALGFGIVVLRAILSDRLRLRMEVASALNASVIVSARRISPLPRLLRIVRWLPWLSAEHAGRAAERERVAHAIENAVPEGGGRQCLAVLCLNDSDEMRFGVALAAVQLQRKGRMTTIVDLSDAGKVASAVNKSAADAGVDGRPAVFRPSVVPSRAEGPADIDGAAWEDLALANAKNRITIVLADFDPAIGVDHLTAWTDSVVLAVTAGRSSVELVRTAGDLVRAAGLQLCGAVLLRTERDDVSSGIAPHVADTDSQTAKADMSLPEPSAELSS